MNLYESIKSGNLVEGNPDLGYIAEYFPTLKAAKEFAVDYYKEGKFDKITEEGNEFAVHVFYQPKTNTDLPTEEEVEAFLKDAEDLKEAVVLPNLNQILKEINDLKVYAEPIEDEEGITIKVLDGLLKMDGSTGEVTFDAPWLPVNARNIEFTSITEFLTCLEVIIKLTK